MNIQRKGTSVRECERCDWNYMVAGDVDIRLSQHRRADLDPKTGKEMHGVCPRCKTS